jgi:acyl-CoA thioesterase
MNDIPLSDARRNQLREVFARIPFANFLGIKLDELQRGSAILSLGARDELTRDGGLMHGGAFASLIDTASAFATLTLLEPEQRAVTIDLTIHYLRPVTGGTIKAHARALRAGRRVITLSVEVTNQDDALVATAVTTYLI